MGPQEGEEHPLRERAEDKDCPGGSHLMQREVRRHPIKVGFSQDRLVCGRDECGFVLYDWAGAFKPNPQAADRDPNTVYV